MSTLQQLTKLLTQKQLTIAVAESCTGGALSSLLTSQSGASVYFDRGFITYSNQAKMDMLNVSKQVLAKFGAVSEQTANQMVRGVITHAQTDIAVAITGIAGPMGGTINKPVGMVCFGFCVNGKYSTSIEFFNGNRKQVIKLSVDFVISYLVEILLNNKSYNS
jgi:nicotinamide-nucleotide amidase